MTPKDRADKVAERLREITGDTVLEVSLGVYRLKVQVLHAETWVDPKTDRVWVEARITTVGEPEVQAEPTGGWR